VHVDFNGTGGFAHIIENTDKYTQSKALEVMSGALGNVMVNINQPLRKEKCEKYLN
jgi:hypothetical protein